MNSKSALSLFDGLHQGREGGDVVSPSLRWWLWATKNGEVGFGTGKAGEVPEAIGKDLARGAKKSFRKWFTLTEGRTIAHAKVVEEPLAPPKS